jgi:hypothetical protein
MPLRVAVLSPQPIVAEGLRAILATLRGHAELVPLDSLAPDPDVVLYDAIGLLRDATDLDILVNKTTSTVLVVSHDLRPGLAAEALAAGADGHISLAAASRRDPGGPGLRGDRLAARGRRRQPGDRLRGLGDRQGPAGRQPRSLASRGADADPDR